jgi:mannose-6-phosphate isomerase
VLLEPILMPKVWGGRRLADYGKDLPTDGSYGESWEVADLASTSPGGGGGGAVRSRITNGAMAGRPLHEALDAWGSDLVGAPWARATDFPLLAKLLDARQHLSVQVHPTREYAAAHPGTHVKAESWYIVDADPGAELFIGLQPGVGRDDVRHAITAGRVPDVLRSVTAVPGYCHHLPSGTVHALGGGVLVAEIQSPSDTTFRLYDWTAEYGRPRRELHVDAALDAMLLEDPPAPTHLPAAQGHALLATTGRYRLHAVRGVSFHRCTADACSVLMCVDGEASVTSGTSTLHLAQGTTVVVPASRAADTTINAMAGTVLAAELSP